MRRAPKRAITPPAAMPPTMPSTENTAVSEPTAAKSSPMSRRNSGAAMMTLPTCNAATTPAPTMASTAAQRVPAGVPPCPSPVRRMPCSVFRARAVRVSCWSIAAFCVRVSKPPACPSVAILLSDNLLTQPIDSIDH